MSTGTIRDPKFIEGFSLDEDGLRMHGEYVIYQCELGLVCGTRVTVKFTLDGSRREVWPFFKDQNAWMNPASYYFSHTIDDLEEGQTYRTAMDPNDLDGPHQWRLDKVLPEYVIVKSQLVPKGEYVGPTGKFGLGRVPAGYVVIGLDQFEPGKTEVAFFMEHSTLVAQPEDAEAMSDEEAMAPWLPVMDAVVPRWRDVFLPALRKLVAESAA